MSTEDQTTLNQELALQRMAEARGFTLIETYRETESSAKRLRELERLRKEIHAGRVSTLFVAALDRLSRSMYGTVQLVLELDKAGCRIVSAREPWLDTDARNPTRDLLIAVFGWVAQQERAVLIERTKAGVERARRQGKSLGRPRVKVSAQAAAWARKNGHSDAQTARGLGISLATLRRLLRAARAQNGGVLVPSLGSLFDRGVVGSGG